MVEIEKSENFASKGVGGAGLGLGIAGTALGLLNNGSFGNLFGGGNNCHGNGYTREDAAKDARIAELTSEIKLRDATTFVLEEANKMRNYVDGRFSNIEAQLCQQSVVNAGVTSNLACLTNQVNVLNSLTKTVIPIASICPTPAVATTTTTT